MHFERREDDKDNLEGIEEKDTFVFCLGGDFASKRRR